MLLAITAKGFIMIGLLVLMIGLAVWDYYNTPAIAEPPGDKFNPYCEEFEEGFSADYEAKDKWRREYEHMN